MWHLRLGDVNFDKTAFISKHELILRAQNCLKNCKMCTLNKITRTPFECVERKSEIMDLIHSDLCDFHSKSSLGNKKYVITFIDDFSKFCYVYLLHTKDKAFKNFKIYKSEVEIQIGSKLKSLRIDKRGKYYDPTYFISMGIVHETTAGYAPQSNGVAERKKRTLQEMVYFMLTCSSLSEIFWGEAMLTTCHIFKRVPTRTNKETAYELWYKENQI